MAGPLGKLTAVLGLDAREFQTGIGDAQKSVSGFGLNAQTGFKVAGAAAAVGFGMMAKGALEMERAQGNFQAATGASREEAVAFSRDMNELVGSAGAVGMSFEDIADVGTTVAQQFGVTGDEAQALTGDILAFSKVTGQDAAGAASLLEDTLSAFGLEAEDAAGLMDQLVASNQKFGTDAGPVTLGVLQGMAPALQAMGMEVDDGVALLNAFEVAGLDASAAQRALNAAVKNLPPGQNMDDVIARLSAIEDPAARAQAAIEIFGAKAGVGLANVIKPGMTSLDDFKVSAEEAGGAVDQASEDMLTTGDRIKMFADKAGAALRGLGQDFGPLLSGMGGLVSAASALPSSLTKPLTDGLKATWAKVAGSAPVKAAIAAAGAIVGPIYSGAMKLAEVIGDALSAVWRRIVTSAPIKAAAALAGTAAGTAYAVAHEIAVTGAAALRSFLAKFGLMTGAKVAAATAAGTAAGVAEGTAAAAGASSSGVLGKAKTAGAALGKLGIIAGIAVGIAEGQQILVEALDVAIGGTLTHAGQRAQILGQTTASAVAMGFSKTAADEIADAAATAFDQALAQGKAPIEAARAADVAAQAAANGFQTGFNNAMADPNVAPNMAAYGDLLRDDAARAGTEAGTTGGTSFVDTWQQTIEQGMGELDYGQRIALATEEQLAPLMQVLQGFGPQFQLTGTQAEAFADVFDLSAQQVQRAFADMQAQSAARILEFKQVLGTMPPEFDRTGDAARKLAQDMGLSAEEIESVFGKAEQVVTRSLGDITGALSGLGSSADSAWQQFKDATQKGTEDPQARIEKLQERLRKLNEVDLMSLGPAALAGWASARDATVQELGGLVSFVNNQGQIVQGILPAALNQSQQDSLTEWQQIFGNAEGTMTGIVELVNPLANQTANALPNALSNQQGSLSGELQGVESSVRSTFGTTAETATDKSAVASTAMPEALSGQMRALGNALAAIGHAVRDVFGLMVTSTGVAAGQIASKLPTALGASARPLGNVLRSLAGALNAAWNSMAESARRGGGSIGAAFIRSLASVLQSGWRSIDSALDAIRRRLGGSLPEIGPLAGGAPAKGGKSIGEAWHNELMRGIGGDISSALIGVRRQLSSPLTGPSLGNRMSTVPALAGATGGIVVNMTVHGNVYGRGGVRQLARDIEEELRFSRRGNRLTGD